MRLLTGVIVAWALAFATACSSDHTTGATVRRQPARLSIVSGDSQVGTAGQQLPNPLVVSVLDSTNQPDVGQLVNFVVTAGGGTVYAGAALTNSAGQAQELWTLGPVPYQPQTLEARAVDNTTGKPLLFATFYAIANPGSSGATFQSLSAGGAFSCGLTAAGEAYCWGWAGPELGEGAISATLPVDIPMPVSTTLAFTEISASPFGTGVANEPIQHTCALTSAGAAYCWGNNDYGELGNGSTLDANTPSPVSGGLAFAHIYTSQGYTCALTPAGKAYCWGQNLLYSPNYGGMLGDSTLNNRSVPTPVVGGLTFASLSAKSTVTCGITPAGALYCWGIQNSSVGILGDGTFGNIQYLAPNPMSGNLAFVSIAVEKSHACGIVAGGAAYCWGGNPNGELGNGTTTNALTPSAVSGGISFQAIGVGSNYTCGLATTGLAYCWGWNDGFADSRPWNNGVSINSPAPVAIPGGIQFGSLSVGALHACGVSVSPAQGYCWLYNQTGEIGNGLDPSDGPTGYYTPQAVR